MFQKIKKETIDTIFPIFCVGCGKEGGWLCNECENTIIPTNNQFCPKCNKKTLFGEVCEKCKNKSYLDGLISFGFYHNPILRKLITNLKYNNAKEIIKNIDKFILKFLNKYSFEFNDYIVVPIPLHKKRKWLRGFNQAELISNIIAKKLKLPVNCDLVERNVFTLEQTKISNVDRLENTLNAFGCIDKGMIKDKNFLLVDDVYTTGATMQECAKILKENGAKKVEGMVLARG